MADLATYTFLPWLRQGLSNSVDQDETTPNPDLRAALDALTEEINAQVEEVQLRGSVARAWVFLHLLHDSGAAP